MNELEKAAQLSVLNEADQVSRFLKMQEILGTSDASKVLAEYEKIKSGKIKVVKVVTSLALSDQQTEQLKQKISTKFSSEKLVFAFVVEPSVAYGIEIRIGDDLIEFSFS